MAQTEQVVDLVAEKDDTLKPQAIAQEEPKEGALIVLDQEEKTILRKIDLHLMPLMFITYGLQYLDKITLGYAAVLGLKDDTHLVGQQYSWTSSIFYFGYLFASIPGSYGFVKLPLGKFLAASMILWAIVLACHGAASSFATLMVLRFLLGALESVISPGFSLITSLWYKPSEHAWRHGLWFAGNGTASIFGGLLGYAIGKIDDDLAPWRWLFIIFGLFTLVWSILLTLFLPDSALKAKWLTPHERQVAHSRPQKRNHSFKTDDWKLCQAVEAVKDPKTWLLFLYTILTSFPNGGYTNFSSLIIKGFNYGTLQTLLLGMPQGACQVIFVLGSAYLTTKIRKSRCITIAGLQCISLLGWALVGYLPEDQTGWKLFGVFIFGAYAAGFPLSLSMIASDVAGYTKKTVVSAILFVAYCAGNISGPQVFLEREAPFYRTGCEVYIICLALAVLDILILRQYMDWENKRRDRKQGAVIEAEPKKRLAEEADDLPSFGVDETDWEQARFRYIL